MGACITYLLLSFDPQHEDGGLFYIFSFGREMIFRNIGVDMNFEYTLSGSLLDKMGKHFCLSFSRILYLHAAVIF